MNHNLSKVFQGGLQPYQAKTISRNKLKPYNLQIDRLNFRLKLWEQVLKLKKHWDIHKICILIRNRVNFIVKQWDTVLKIEIIYYFLKIRIFQGKDHNL